MTGQRGDILQVLAVYKQRLAEFEREMETLGVKVEVSASFGKWTSTVQEVENKTIKVARLLDKLETALLKANIPEEKWKILKELRGLLTPELSLCVKCVDFNRCHQIVVEAERRAFPIMREAFKKCGAKNYAMLNMVYECEHLKEAQK